MSPTFKSLLAMLTGPLGVSLAYRLEFNSLSLEYLQLEKMLQSVALF